MRNRSVVLCALALCGCGTSPIKDGFVSQQWAHNMAELGVNPLFPPREDVYVGDVFLSYEADAAAPAPDAASAPDLLTPQLGLPRLGVFFASIDFKQALADQYVARPEFYDAAASSPGAPKAAATSTSIFGGPTVQTRLKTVAFPYFFTASATGAQIGGFIPIEGLSAKAGISLSAVSSASVTISSAESYSLPWVSVNKSIFDAAGKLTFNNVSNAELMQALKRLNNYPDTGTNDKYIYLTVISEVFYARAFDVSIHQSKDSGAFVGVTTPTTAASSAAATAASAAADVTTAAKKAQAAAVTASQAASTAEAAKVSTQQVAANAASAAKSGKPATAASAAKEAASAASASAVAASTAASAASASDDAQTALALAKAVKAQADADLADAKGLLPSAPGISVGYSRSQSGDVGLRATYEHPIAVGYRGVRYRVNLKDGSFKVVPIPVSPVFDGTTSIAPGVGAGTPPLPLAGAASAPAPAASN